jgi:hypothetical protein
MERLSMLTPAFSVNVTGNVTTAPGLPVAEPPTVTVPLWADTNVASNRRIGIPSRPI